MKDQVICTGGAPASMLLGEDVNDFDLYFKNRWAVSDIATHYVERFLKFQPDCKIRPSVQVTDEPNRVRIHIQSAGVAGEGGDKTYEYFEATPDERAANDFLDKMEVDPSERDIRESIDAIEVDPTKTNDKKPKDKEPFRPRFLSENAISLSDDIQIIIRFFGSVEEIHQNYDFAHCKCAYDYANDSLSTPPSALLSLMSRTLYYTGSLYPLCSMFRMRKFIDRGWHISAGEILKMGFQLSELDLRDVMVLRDQLIGVDMAYFAELLDIIDNEKAGQEGKPIDASYIGQLVDRVFNS